MVAEHEARPELRHHFADEQQQRNAASLGMSKGVIMLGHVISEQPGMEDLTNWMRTFLHDVPIQFVSAEEPFW